MFDDIPGGGAGGAAPDAPAAELTLEQQLEALKPTGNESTPNGADPSADPKPDGEPGADPSQSPAEPILEKLDQIKDDAPAKDEQSNLTAEQQQILQAIPNAQTFQQLQGLTQGYQAFTGAFESGKFEEVEGMFQNWNPQAWDAFLNHIYEKKVNSGEWVERYITEKENNPVNKSVLNLQNQIKDLQTQIKDRTTQEQTSAQQAQQQRIVKQYVDHIDGLFDQIEFAPADRRWVTADIHNRVAADPRVRAAINGGNIAAVNAIFKTAVREYVQRDQAAAQTKEAKLKAQGQHKTLPQGGGAPVVEGLLPDDIKQVPKGQEDNWMDQQLAKLKFAKRK